MQVITRINDVKTSTRKVRIVADSIRGLSLGEAQDALSVIDKRGAHDLEKALNSAVANAVNNANLQKSDLVIKTIDVNEGTFLKRFRPSTRGRVHPYKKRTSNIRIVLEDKTLPAPKVEAVASLAHDKKELKAIPAKTEITEDKK
jgi:large subunit ribosomal protein L22